MQGEIKELLSSKWAEESKACRGVPLLTPSVVLSFLKPFSPRFLFILFLFPACAIHHRKDFLAPCAATAISVSSIRQETPASPLPCRQHRHRALTCCLQPLGMENMTSDRARTQTYRQVMMLVIALHTALSCINAIWQCLAIQQHCPSSSGASFSIPDLFPPLDSHWIYSTSPPHLVPRLHNNTRIVILCLLYTSVDGWRILKQFANIN